MMRPNEPGFDNLIEAGVYVKSARVLLDRLRHGRPWDLRLWLGRLGLPGIAAVGLLTACAAFYASIMIPLHARIDEVHSAVLALSERVEQVSGGGRKGALPVTEQLLEFHSLFPQQSQLTDTIGKIFELAQVQGIVLPQGEYRLADEKVGKLQRFQIMLPIKAEYPSIRRFLSSISAELPTTVLEHIQFERQKIGDPQVEATIKLALYVERES